MGGSMDSTIRLHRCCMWCYLLLKPKKKRFSLSVYPPASHPTWPHINENRKFQSDDLLFLITDLERSRKSTITNCFSFFDIPIRSVSKLSSNMVKVGKFKKKLTYPAFPTSEAFLKHFLSEFGKNKGSFLFYFSEIFPNMILKVLKNQVEIFHFYQYSYFW